MIVFDEYKHCEYLLNNKIERIYQRDLNYLASYWFEDNSERKVAEKLKEWCLKQNPDYNLIINRKRIKNAVTHGRKYALRKVITVTVSKAELESIQKISDYRVQKVLFGILVTARFFKYNNSRKTPRMKPENIGLYYNKNYREVLKLVGVSLKAKEWKMIKKELRNLELLEQTMMGKMRVMFVNDESVPVIAIDDYRNIIGYYQEYCGERMIRCEDCGVSIVKKQGNHNRCLNCYRVHRLNDIRKNMKKYRGKI